MSAPVKNSSSPPLDLGDLRAAPVSQDGEDVRVGDVDDLPPSVEVVDRNGGAVSQDGRDPDSTINANVPSVVRGDDSSIEYGVFHEFPPIGQALVGPKSKYERDENGVVQFSVLPFDSTRTWRIVKSDHKS